MSGLCMSSVYCEQEKSEKNQFIEKNINVIL